MGFFGQVLSFKEMKRKIIVYHFTYTYLRNSTTLFGGVVFQFFPFSCKLQLFRVATATKVERPLQLPNIRQKCEKCGQITSLVIVNLGRCNLDASIM